MGKGIDAAAGDAAQAAHGARPNVAGALVERERENGAMRQAIVGGVGLPGVILVDSQAVFGAGPDTRSPSTSTAKT